MTVIVLSKFENTYFIHADGRCSMDWMGIHSDNATKVHQGKGYIWGFCGSCDSILPLEEALKKTQDPIKLLRYLNSKAIAPYLSSFGILVATKKHGAYQVERRCSAHKEIECDEKKRPKASLMKLSDEQLPQTDGSGFLSVKTLLIASGGKGYLHKVEDKEHHSDAVKAAITDSYLVNHTIGGEIKELRLDI